MRLVKSRSNSRGSILEDFLVSQANMKNMTSSLNLSLTTVLGVNECDNLCGTQSSSYQTYYKVHESACEYEFVTITNLALDHKCKPFTVVAESVFRL